MKQRDIYGLLGRRYYKITLMTVYALRVPMKSMLKWRPRFTKVKEIAIIQIRRALSDFLAHIDFSRKCACYSEFFN